MGKNIGVIGRLIRIIIGMVMIYMAIKIATEQKRKKPACYLALFGFIGILQGYNGVCVVKKLGLPIPF